MRDSAETILSIALVSSMLGLMANGSVNRVLRDVSLGLLRERWSRMTFGELEQILASPMGQALRPVQVAELTMQAPRTSELRRGFERLEREIVGLVLPDGGKVKGRRLVPKLVRIFAQLVEGGCSDLVGLTCDVIRQIDDRVSGVGLVSESTSDALRALAKSSCGLVLRPTARTWRIRLADLGQPQSAFYKHFCGIVAGRAEVDAASLARNPARSAALRSSVIHQAVRGSRRRSQLG
jgi:hypothetical protein